MFCNQCEQTWRSDTAAGCNAAKGMCGKDATTADLQDVLLQVAKGIGWWAGRARALGASDDVAGGFILSALFTTLTNVNFSAARFVPLITEAAQVRDRVKAAALAAAATANLAAPSAPAGAELQPGVTQEEMLANASACGLRVGVETVGEDVIGLRSLILFGLKGVCAYAHHAQVLGYEKPEIYAGVEQALTLLAEECADAGALVEGALALGRVNFTVMELLDAANTGSFGHPAPTSVRTAPVKGKAILVSGHDMKDLKAILEATKDQGVNVYTHGELLPAHAYPALQAYPHLVGNYGGAWQDQQREFAAFPGAIVMTSNCIIEPQASYRQRLFTAGPVGWPGVRHIAGGNFASVVQAAKALPGFAEDAPETRTTIGFARETVLGAAGTVVEAVKSGAIQHFFLIGGCDGAAPGRNYFTDVAEKAPANTVLMTLGCGKYRFNDKEFGTIGGLPRLLDVGQCNDAYSAVVIASALAKAFECGVNDLPLTLMVSWFEQKAAAVLLTLLALGVRHVKLGPTLPAFLTPGLLNVLVETFGVQPIGDAQADIDAALARAA